MVQGQARGGTQVLVVRISEAPRFFDVFLSKATLFLIKLIEHALFLCFYIYLGIINLIINISGSVGHYIAFLIVFLSPESTFCLTTAIHTQSINGS